MGMRAPSNRAIGRGQWLPQQRRRTSLQADDLHRRQCRAAGGPAGRTRQGLEVEAYAVVEGELLPLGNCTSPAGE